MNQFKIIIVDDERLAREEIKRELINYPQFIVIGEVSNADEALELIETQTPDLIFLDIHMPEKSGFDLLSELTATPEVVFTTAYNQYAVDAFEVNALDYLMKPLREERFAKMIEKVQSNFSSKNSSHEKSISANKKIFIKDGEKCYFILLSEVRLIESVDNYARLFFNESKAMIKRSLNLLEEKLDSEVFFRANRSQIVNINYINKIYPYFKNKLKIELITGEILEISSRQSVRFKSLNYL